MEGYAADRQKTDRMRTMLLLLTVGNFFLGANAQELTRLDNGIYLILEELEIEPSPNHMGSVVRFDHGFLDSNTEGQPIYLQIDANEMVSLDLAEKPEGIPQEDKRLNLMLTLSENGKQQLADFTTKHLNKRVAIVIGGRAVTKHKVRTVIDGGKLQITRCTDNACEHLLLELKENYRE